MSRVINIDKYRLIKKGEDRYEVYSPLYDGIICVSSLEYCKGFIENNYRMQEDYLVEEDENGLFIKHTAVRRYYCNCHPETCCCSNEGVTTTYESRRYEVSGEVKKGDFIRVDIGHVHGNIIVK